MATKSRPIFRPESEPVFVPVGMGAVRTRLRALPPEVLARLQAQGLARVEHLALLDDLGIAVASEGDPTVGAAIREMADAAEVVARGRWARDGRVEPEDRIARGVKRAREAAATMEEAALERGALPVPGPPRGGRLPTRRARAAVAGAPASRLPEIDENARQKQLERLASVIMGLGLPAAGQAGEDPSTSKCTLGGGRRTGTLRASGSGSPGGFWLRWGLRGPVGPEIS